MGVWGKLQALVYDIIPLEEGVGKRCSECGSGEEDGSISGHVRCSCVWVYLSFDQLNDFENNEGFLPGLCVGGY